MAKTVTIQLTDEQHAAVRGAFTKLRAARAAQSGFGRAKAHPLAGKDREAAIAWFLAAALVTGADELADEGPG